MIARIVLASDGPRWCGTVDHANRGRRDRLVVVLDDELCLPVEPGRWPREVAATEIIRSRRAGATVCARRSLLELACAGRACRRTWLVPRAAVRAIREDTARGPRLGERPGRTVQRMRRARALGRARFRDVERVRNRRQLLAALAALVAASAWFGVTFGAWRDASDRLRANSIETPAYATQTLTASGTAGEPAPAGYEPPSREPAATGIVWIAPVDLLLTITADTVEEARLRSVRVRGAHIEIEAAGDARELAAALSAVPGARDVKQTIIARPTGVETTLSVRLGAP
ncbi:MAG: hypothetical protein ACOC1U_07955 [Spirochaetota bacterium]